MENTLIPISSDHLSHSVKGILPNHGAQHLFVKYYNDAVKNGCNSRSIAYAKAWMGIDDLGFKKNQYGIYNRVEPVNKAAMKGVYTSVKPDQNTLDLLLKYIQANNIPNPVPAEKMHSTVLYSKEPFSGYQPRMEITIVKPQKLTDDWGYQYGMGQYSIELMGPDKKALVLVFDSCELMDQFWLGMALGASWDHRDKYGGVDKKCHVTLSYNVGDGFDLSALTPPDFEMVFMPETIDSLEDDWSDSMKSIDIETSIFKTSEDKQLVYVWASVVEKDGEIVTDLQGDQIEEDDIVKAAHDFILNSRVGKTYHNGGQKAEIVESMVFTKELQKALDIIIKDPEDGKQISGWMVCFKIMDDETWQLVKSGQLSCASIGGMARKIPVE